jgi:CRISPR-associated protein Cmr6
MMQALATRQAQHFASIPSDSTLRLDALAIAPFTTGLGNEHPLENSFAFLNPYGLPYLPGSGVKGVLRQAARELASGEWGDAHGWSEAPCYPLLKGVGEKRKPVLDKHKQPVSLSMLDVLFGRESANGDTEHVRGALTFWDVIPQIKGDSLAVEIVTPHQSHYYQQKQDRKSGDSTTPHDSGAPNPISFLTVPPGSGFAFHVRCDLAHLARLAPDLAKDNLWKTLLEAAFAHAFKWLGFGAKTAVGYGAMKSDTEAAQRRVKEMEQREADAKAALEEADRQAKRATMTPALLAVQDFIDYMTKRHESLRGKPTRANGEEHNRARQLSKAAQDSTDWTPDEKRAAAEALAEWLPKVVAVDMKDERKKLKLAVLRGEV